jgi:hypothetical protein
MTLEWHCHLLRPLGSRFDAGNAGSCRLITATGSLPVIRENGGSLTGGGEVWPAIELFFADLDANSSRR